MKLVRYQNLSQYVDTNNLYKNSTFLSDVFVFGDEFFVFMKQNSNNDIYMSKETIAGGFEVVKIPLSTWGIYLNEQNLVKCYKLSGININLLSFKINTSQYLTILENNAGNIAIFIDNTDDSIAMNFLNTGCPLLYTKEDDNQTIHSFNNREDGTHSAMLFNTLLTWDDFTDVTPVKLNSILTETIFSTSSFNLLSTDSANVNSVIVYSTSGGIPSIYSRDFDAYTAKLLNQSNKENEYTLYKNLDIQSITNYISTYFDNTNILVYFNNNTMIFFTGSSYVMYNIFAYHTKTDFEYEYIFDITSMKYNLFKQFLYTFRNIPIDTINNLRIGSISISSDTFMQVESNVSVVLNTVYKNAVEFMEYINSTIELCSSIQQTNSDVILTNSQVY